MLSIPSENFRDGRSVSQLFSAVFLARVYLRWILHVEMPSGLGLRGRAGLAGVTFQISIASPKKRFQKGNSSVLSLDHEICGGKIKANACRRAFSSASLFRLAWAAAELALQQEDRETVLPITLKRVA